MKGVGPRISTPEARMAAFWANVDQSGDCWEWLAAKDTCGYGRTQLFSVAEGAHRASYRLRYGDIPAGLVIDHMCHNRGCVRPEHLRAVTHKQNIENHIGRPQSNNKSSGVRGVSWCSKSGKWRAIVGHHGTLHHIGRYDRLEDATAAVVAKRNELFTHNDLDRKSA